MRGNPGGAIKSHHKQRKKGKYKGKSFRGSRHIVSFLNLKAFNPKGRYHPKTWGLALLRGKGRRKAPQQKLKLHGNLR